MRIKTIQLKDFKRFNDLTINLGDTPKRIVALVGPNGSGKSSVFDGLETFSTDERDKGRMRYRRKPSYYKKSLFQWLGITSTPDPDTDNDDFESRQHVFITSDQSTYTSTSFYIRSAHRFTPRIEVKQIRELSKVEDDEKRPKQMIDVDSRLEENYERLIGSYFDETYDKEVTGKKWVEQNIQNLNDSLLGILDISIISLGNPTKGEGSLYFKKGNSDKIPYENLSSGEKEVVDLILDVYIKRSTYTNSVVCIDEPELHLNTSIQRKLLNELDKIIPPECQIWVATHSIGFLRALQEDLKDKASVIDFNGHNFDEIVTLSPIKGARRNWANIFETALEDLTGLLAPKRIIYCEGKIKPAQDGTEQGLDAEVYNTIFSEEYPDSLFVSSGGSTQPDQYGEIALAILGKAFQGVELLILKDMDINGNGSVTTSSQREEWLSGAGNRRMLDRKEMENYLLEYDVIKKAYPIVTEDSYKALIPDISAQNVKEKTGDIMRLCGITTGMNKKDFMLRLAREVTSDVSIYKTLKKLIFESPVSERSNLNG